MNSHSHKNIEPGSSPQYDIWSISGAYDVNKRVMTFLGMIVVYKII